MNIKLPGKAATFMASQREQAEKQRTRLGIEARSWYRISNAASDDEAEVMIYDEVGGWWGCTADDLIAELKGITAPRMRVRINSPGGSVFEGIAIANALRAHPASVTVQVDAVAASIASVIAMAGDRIEMAPNSMIMIHDASGMCWGNAQDMEEMAELLDLISDNIADAYAQRAGGTREQWRERMRAETWYLPDDAVDNGLADEAVQAPKAGTPSTPQPAEEEPEMARAWDLAAYGYQGPRREEPTPAAGTSPEMQRFAATVAELLGADMAARIRAMFENSTPVEEPEEPGEGPSEGGEGDSGGEGPTEPPVEPPAEDPEPEPEPVPPPEEPGPVEIGTVAQADEWAATVAHLIKTKPDPWAAAVAHLTNSTSAARSATEAA